jgi:hypothetical protein
MSDIDKLSQMARALRESRTGRHANPGSSRAVILTEAASKKRRRRLGVVWLVPLAAVLVISTAVAGVGPAGRFVWKRYLARIVGADRNAEVVAAASGSTVPASVVAAPPDEPAPLAASEPEPVQVKGPAEANVPRVRAASPRAARAAKVAKRAVAEPAEESKPGPTAEPAAAHAPSAPAIREDEDGRLYARAHEAHFVERNPSAALTAWDDYLAARPDGRFALEARYNRALCLVRLERLDEAKAALEPFRQGRFGSYRQVEATRLLDALNHR